MPRFCVLPQTKIERESWRLRSSFVLDRYYEDHEFALETLGLEKALERAEVGPFLVSQKKALQELHSIRDAGLCVVPYGRGGLVPMPAAGSFPSLVREAERIARELDCEPGPVVSFLLTGKAFTLPWIEIEHRVERLGLSFVIHVGSADVTAEEVRQAYVAAVREALGSHGARPLPAHVVPLVLKDAEGRRAGLTWEQRFEEWQRYACEWSITGHVRSRGEGEKKTGYKNVESYRAYIYKLMKQIEWVRLELESAKPERVSREGEAGRGSPNSGSVATEGEGE